MAAPHGLTVRLPSGTTSPSQALGTSAGTVHIFELGPGASGNEWRRINAHQGRVLDICVDVVSAAGPQGWRVGASARWRSQGSS